MWWWIGLLTVAGLVIGVAVVARKPKLRRAVVRVVKKQVKRRVATTQRARRAVRQPAKAPLANRSQRPGKPSVVRPTKCSAACRMSKKPLYDKEGRLACDCPCQGRYHGMYKPGSNASLRSKGRVSGAPAAKVSMRKPAALPAPTARTATAVKPQKTAVAAPTVRAAEAVKPKKPAALKPAAPKKPATSRPAAPKKPAVSKSPAPKKAAVSKPAPQPAPTVRTATVTRPKPTTAKPPTPSGVPPLPLQDQIIRRTRHIENVKKIQAHCETHPACRAGTSTANTIRNTRTGEIRTTIRCDTCKAVF